MDYEELERKHQETLAKVKDLESKVGQAPEGHAFVPKEDLERFKQESEQGKKALEALAIKQKAEDDNTLKSEFPKLNDLSVVVGATLDEKRESAKKLYSAFGLDKEPKQEETPKPKSEQAPQEEGSTTEQTPDGRWKGAGSLGQPTTEQAQQEAKEQLTKDMVSSIKSGNVKDVISLCMQGQPNAVKALGNILKK